MEELNSNVCGEKNATNRAFSTTLFESVQFPHFFLLMLLCNPVFHIFPSSILYPEVSCLIWFPQSNSLWAHSWSSTKDKEIWRKSKPNLENARVRVWLHLCQYMMKNYDLASGIDTVYWQSFLLLKNAKLFTFYLLLHSIASYFRSSISINNQ